MSNDHLLKVALAEHQEEQRRKQRGLMSDQYNLDCSRNPPLPEIDYSAGRYTPKQDNGERNRRSDKVSDPVNKPAHYTGHPSGVECITITEHMGFNLGNALKYIWRCDLKSGAIEDLKKAAWYINREISKREGKKA